MSNLGNFSLLGQRVSISFPSVDVHLGVLISRKMNTGGVLNSQEISTGEYSFSEISHFLIHQCAV